MATEEINEGDIIYNSIIGAMAVVGKNKTKVTSVVGNKKIGKTNEVIERDHITKEELLRIYEDYDIANSLEQQLSRTDTEDLFLGFLREVKKLLDEK